MRACDNYVIMSTQCVFAYINGDKNLFEEGLKTTPNSQRLLDALAIDDPLEYARLVLDNEMHVWIDAEASLEVW